MKNIGIIQGRLLPPVNGFIQEFPETRWHEEFILLESLGLSHVEWIITEKSYGNNPFLTELGSLASYPISCVCCDHVINENIKNIEFLKEKLIPVCEAAKTHNVNTIGIPLLELSSIENAEVRKRFIYNIQHIHDMYQDLTFSFEAELDWPELKELVDLRDKFKVTYDTGNITSYNNKHGEYIENLFHKIDNVHLKDRANFNLNGWKTVFPTTGQTNFFYIFNLLKNLRYNQRYTLQTARSLDGLEKSTVSYHNLLLRTIYESINPGNVRSI